MSKPDDHRIPSPAARYVLVAGATGRFGGIAGLLLGRGHQVRAAVRDPAGPAAAWLAARGAEIVRADFEDPASLAAAAREVHAVFASGTAHRAGPGGGERPRPTLRTWSLSPEPERTGPARSPCSRPSGPSSSECASGCCRSP